LTYTTAFLIASATSFLLYPASLGSLAVNDFSSSSASLTLFVLADLPDELDELDELDDDDPPDFFKLSATACDDELLDDDDDDDDELLDDRAPCVAPRSFTAVFAAPKSATLANAIRPHANTRLPRTRPPPSLFRRTVRPSSSSDVIPPYDERTPSYSSP
jgi:hypothetical protein